jgi:hypothetical protein
MNRKRVTRTVCRCACAGLALVLGGTASGQYETDFEALSASGPGMILTGQDSFYLPDGVDSTDYLAYTYAGNALGLPPNPEGGLQFVGGVGPGSPIFARGQRDITWATTGQWVITYDVACVYLGAPPSANNLGSLSFRLAPANGGPAGFIHLFSWVDFNTATNWQAYYMAYDAAGVQFAQPGLAPPGTTAWDNLELNHWYRFEMVVDFDLNMITEVSITDLDVPGSTVTAQPADWYLAGGTGTPGDRTGFRLFAGGGVPDNGVAFDNLSFGEPASCPADLNGDGVVDVVDLLLLLGNWGNPGTGDINGDGTVNVEDLLLLLAAWGPC